MWLCPRALLSFFLHVYVGKKTCLSKLVKIFTSFLIWLNILLFFSRKFLFFTIDFTSIFTLYPNFNLGFEVHPLNRDIHEFLDLSLKIFLFPFSKFHFAPLNFTLIFTLYPEFQFMIFCSLNFLFSAILIFNFSFFFLFCTTYYQYCWQLVN